MHAVRRCKSWDFFSKFLTLGLFKNQGGTAAGSKRAKLSKGIGCENSFAGGFFASSSWSLGTLWLSQKPRPWSRWWWLSLTIRDRVFAFAFFLLFTMAIQWQCKFSAQLCRTKSPTGHTVFFTGHTTTQLGAQWWSLSQCQLRCTCHIQESNIQSNLPTQTAEFIVEACHVFFHAVQHWL